MHFVFACPVGPQWKDGKQEWSGIAACRQEMENVAGVWCHSLSITDWQCFAELTLLRLVPWQRLIGSSQGAICKDVGSS